MELLDATTGQPFDNVPGENSAKKRLPNNPRKSSSFTSQVADLDVGDTASKTIAVQLSGMSASYVQDMATLRDNARNNVASAVRIAKERSGGTYTVEVCDLFCPSGRLFIIVLITRTT